MNKRKLTVTVAVLILLLAGGIWAFVSRPDPEVERLKQMQDTMLAATEPGKRPSREQFERMRKEMDKLTDSQRRQVMQHGHANMRRFMDKQLDDYFDAPPEKRQEILDQHIGHMEKMRKEMEKRRAARPSGGRQGPAARGGPGAGGPPKGHGRGRRNRTPEARSERHNRMLDHVSPERRAKWSAYFSDLQKRRIALGLPAWPGRHHGGRPHGR